MPYYDFVCTNVGCGAIFEKQLSFAAYDALDTVEGVKVAPCPHDGKVGKRLLSSRPPAFNVGEGKTRTP